MKGSQELLFFYLKSHARFVPFIFVLFPLDFSPTFYGLHKSTAKFSTIASSQDTSNVSRVKACPAQEHMASKAEGITTPYAARAMIFLELQRHGGIVCMTRTQQWRDTHTSGRTEGKKSCYVWRSGLKTIKSRK